MKLFELIKNSFIKLHNRREDLEDKIADILEHIQENDKFDDIEQKIINLGIKAGITYACGECTLTEEQLNNISSVIVSKGINKINPAIQKQLRKRRKI